jgi:hypothetical protein
MKRATLRLMLRRETLRTIADLTLVHVVAGDPAELRGDTGNPGAGCPHAVPVNSAADLACLLPTKP